MDGGSLQGGWEFPQGGQMETAPGIDDGRLVECPVNDVGGIDTGVCGSLESGDDVPVGDLVKQGEGFVAQAVADGEWLDVAGVLAPADAVLLEVGAQLIAPES